jgi:hypothetical protein
MFSIGDRVMMNPFSNLLEDGVDDKENPVCTVGTVVDIEDEAPMPICVSWDNGEQNIYTEDDLVLHKEAVDFVNKPTHYQLVGDVEVKDVIKIILDRWEGDSVEYLSLYQGGCMKEALQYLLRAPLKNGREDVEKALYYLKEIIRMWEEE